MTPRAQAITGWTLGALAYAWLTGCATEDIKPPVTPGIELGEAYCAAYNLPCGHVYQFAAAAENPLGHVEMCVLDAEIESAEQVYGEATLSTDPRFDGGNLCLWQCPSAKMCNAYGGCWCGVPLGYMPSSWIRPAVNCRYAYAPYLGETAWHCPRVQ